MNNTNGFTYAIGDVQGCYKTFQRLLKRVQFNPNADKLWLAGDLVNRGPKSLDVLHFVKDLGPRAVCILGNHEIYLLALYLGVFTRKNTHTLKPILKAKDVSELIDWIRHWPLMHVENNQVLVHAGLLPCWSVKEAQEEARSIEQLLRSEQICEFLSYAYGNEPTLWSNELQGFERHCLALHAFVHMRMCKDANTLKYGFTGDPKDAPKNLKAWYTIPNRNSLDHLILFGHWSALGLRSFANCISLDSGCVWGGSLSAYRLEDGAIFVEESSQS